MRPKLRLSLAGTAILALLGGSGGAVMAQEEDETAPLLATFYTSTWEDTEVLDWGTWEEVGDGHRLRAFIGAGVAEASDPRASGRGTYVHNQDVYDASDMGVRWGSTRQQNDSGGWDGTWMGAMVPTADEGFIYVIVGGYEGTGGYEGLSQVDITLFPEGPGGPGVSQGVIYEGTLPPMEFVEPPPIPAE